VVRKGRHVYHVRETRNAYRTAIRKQRDHLGDPGVDGKILEQATMKRIWTGFSRLRPNVMVEWLTLLLHIWEVTGSNLDPETSYTHQDFRGFLRSLQANAGIVP
jgi:hypothetical protein